MSAAKRLKDKEPRHVRLYHWLMGTEAWRDLDPVAKCIYVELAARYGGPGSRNGSIPCSVRELANTLRIGKSTAQRALAELQEHGFIVLTKRGSFNMKHHHAAEWLLTEFMDDRAGHVGPAKKDFARWKKLKRGAATGTARYPQRDNTVPVAGQLQTVTMADGTHSGTIVPADGPAMGTLLVYQGERRLRRVLPVLRPPSPNPT